ncbi:hypothetical protein TSMEX_008292 [Taenia solium]|eukprot:TsM_000257700 transcript=TsM_000257700 gene=TsM_000257700
MAYANHFFIDLMMANPLPKEPIEADTDEDLSQGDGQQAASARRGDCTIGPSTEQPEIPPHRATEYASGLGTGHPQGNLSRAEYFHRLSTSQVRNDARLEEHLRIPSAGQLGNGPRAGEYLRRPSAGQLGSGPQKDSLAAAVQANLETVAHELFFDVFS